ncbi:MAG: alpha/beta fold hydrolase [Trueperaceae bacterium]|nr:alpha/beta fold hydrolase [Trueperaceae bacterium]
MLWGIFLLLLVSLGLLAWRFSDAILKPEPYHLYPEFNILDYKDGLVRLPKPINDRQFANTLREGNYVLLWADSIGRLGKVQEQDENSVTRELELIVGPPPRPGEAARLDSFVFRRNPKDDHDLSYQELFLEGPAGKLHCWWIEQDPRKAIYLLHGRRRGQIVEVQRILPELVAMGYSVFALSYRNHSQSAGSPNGFYHYAASEWEDALVGLEFLKQQGIAELALYGFSMGGAVSLELYKHLNPNDKSLIKAIILDAPLLDPKDVFRFGARRLGIPALPAMWLTSLTMFTSGLRTGIDWQSLDQRKTAKDISVPVLLFMGTADTTIPIELVDAFAKEVPNLDYVRLEGVEHVEAWNIDPKAYEAKVATFLEANLPVAIKPEH